MIETSTKGTEQDSVLRLITAGSVDDGKSTLIGRLLYDSKTVYEDQLEHVEAASRRRGSERFNLAFLTDGLRAEREQGITIDVAYRYFATSRRKFILADTPGHFQYTRNMVTGASTADLAVILVDAEKGWGEQSRRHAYLASLLGIPHLIFAVNKMDLTGYSQEAFEKIRDEIEAWLSKLRPAQTRSIPVSALEGENIVRPGSSMPWYKGPTLLEWLEQVPPPSKGDSGPMRFPVQWVIRPESRAFPGYRGYAGVVSGGALKAGEEVIIFPTGQRTRISRMDTAGNPLEAAGPGMSVTVHLEQELDVSRGCMLCSPDAIPRISQEFSADVVWLSQRPLKLGSRYALKHTTRWVRAVAEGLDYERNILTLAGEKAGESLPMNGIARIRFKATEPLFFDAYSQNRVTGAFILSDEATNETVGAGMFA